MHLGEFLYVGFFSFFYKWDIKLRNCNQTGTAVLWNRSQNRNLNRRNQNFLPWRNWKRNRNVLRFQNQSRFRFRNRIFLGNNVAVSIAKARFVQTFCCLKTVLIRMDTYWRGTWTRAGNRTGDGTGTFPKVGTRTVTAINHYGSTTLLKRVGTCTAHRSASAFVTFHQNKTFQASVLEHIQFSRKLFMNEISTMLQNESMLFKLLVYNVS